MSWKLSIGTLLLASVTGAAQLSQPDTLVIRAARLYDGRANPVTTPGVVVLRSGKIAAVGLASAIPPDATTIDVGDATLLPGFIDAHTHLGWAYSASYDEREMERMRKGAPEIALDASVWVRKTLMAGFTTVRDLGSTDFIDLALRNAIASGAIPSCLHRHSARCARVLAVCGRGCSWQSLPPDTVLAVCSRGRRGLS